MNENKIIIEVDTRATVTVMRKATWTVMENRLLLQKSHKLHTCIGDKLNVLETSEANIDYQGQHYKLPVIIE